MSLLERDRELAAIDRLIEAAGAGIGRAVLLAGTAGIGKTALLEEAAVRASALRVLRARGGIVEGGLAFGVVRQLLERPLRDASPQARQRWLAGAARPAGTLLLADASPAPGPGDELSMLHALYWLVVGMGDESGILVLVDDVQWADAASLRWLLFLARRLDDLPVAVLGAVREGGLENESAALEAFAGDQSVEVLTPRPLSASATARLIGQSLAGASERFCVAAHTSTAGNPFLLTELLRTVDRAGLRPDDDAVSSVGRLAASDLGRRILRRMTGLSGDASAFAGAVAVLGREATLLLAAELAELSPRAAADAARHLALAEILGDALPLAFVHPLVQSAVYDGLGAARRSAEHARAARLLDGAGADPGVVATHLLRCEPAGDAWAADVLSKAAAQALSNGAPETAVGLAERALAEPAPRQLQSMILRVLGMSLQRLGDASAGRVLARAVDAATEFEQRLQTGMEAAFALSMAGDSATADVLLERLLGEPGAADEHAAVMLRVHALSVSLAAGAPPGERVREELLAAKERLPAMGAAGRYALSVLAMDGALRGGTCADVRSLALAAVGGDDDYRTSLRAGRPLNNALLALALADLPDVAFARWEQALRAARERGSVFAQADSLAWRAVAHLLVGNIRAARADAEAVLDASASAQLLAQMQRPIAIGVLLGVHRLTGAYEAAEKLLVKHRPREDAPLPISELFMVCQGAALRLAQHRPGTALEDLRAVEPVAKRSGAENVRFFPWQSYAGLAHLALGDRAAARRLCTDALDAALRFGSRSSIGFAQRNLALAEEGDAQVALLEQASENLASSPASLERAQALLDHGAALRRAGRRQEARGPLTDALELAHRNGADALVESARIELKAAGARPRRLVRTGVESLTPSELRVAKLAADGLTNRQIAQALFVTPKTVERHLYTAFRKLDVAARHELARALAEAL